MEEGFYIGFKDNKIDWIYEEDRLLRRSIIGTDNMYQRLSIWALGREGLSKKWRENHKDLDNIDFEIYGIGYVYETGISVHKTTLRELILTNWVNNRHKDLGEVDKRGLLEEYMKPKNFVGINDVLTDVYLSNGLGINIIIKDVEGRYIIRNNTKDLHYLNDMYIKYKEYDLENTRGNNNIMIDSANNILSGVIDRKVMGRRIKIKGVHVGKEYLHPMLICEVELGNKFEELRNYDNLEVLTREEVNILSKEDKSMGDAMKYHINNLL